VPDAGKLYTELLQKNGGFYLGDTKKKDIYLTFDNGYENGYTGKILDVLKEKKVPVTFLISSVTLVNSSRSFSSFTAV
ncbi:polysaccharide deacetylase family protein, partial [Bacillus sp. D-CC]